MRKATSHQVIQPKQEKVSTPVTTIVAIDMPIETLLGHRSQFDSYFRCGSKGEVAANAGHFRFAPNNGHSPARSACLRSEH
jgi:hypothetical protein